MAVNSYQNCHEDWAAVSESRYFKLLVALYQVDKLEKLYCRSFKPTWAVLIRLGASRQEQTGPVSLRISRNGGGIKIQQYHCESVDSISLVFELFLS